MITQHKFLTAVSAVLLLVMSTPAGASVNRGEAYQSELDSCLAEVNGRVNQDDNSHVRHTIFLIKNTSIGYLLKINTQIFNDSDKKVAIREYASRCVAKGSAKPVKFKIDKLPD